ncbi:AAA family ATPase [Aliivibrio fischeri]|uniref:AAA family ATPase n=1 Tax=Aliivibrio fischeri TaxID=668 RepID=UPI0012DABB78|nr:AAA family ATPase [Aliivibrio fischeri]MUK42746.1 AAA family ATPase [Aliivibrio fischeri]
MIIGLFLKHIKAYKGINFVPVGHEYKFVTYVGENGVGKSSILETLDSFLNNKLYPINKSALSDGINTVGNEPFVAPIFLIEKSKVKNNKRQFDVLSSYFWSVVKSDLHSGIQTSTKEFFEIREMLLQGEEYSAETHYLIVCGEQNLNSTQKPYFASFHNDEGFLLHFLEQESTILEGLGSVDKKAKVTELKESLKSKLQHRDWKNITQHLKDLYSYVYFPVEIDVESFTKIETTEMQKIFDKKLKNEIETALTSVNFTNQGGINNTLDSFISEIENILGNEYCYDTGQKRNNSVTKSDLVSKILEVYFQKRILNKKTSDGLTRVSELSAGEKRQALINLVYAFLKRNSERETMVIIAVDEPENSLHTALCYDQFEKLKEVSKLNQILITTHWYGFLPVVSEGYGHFLNVNKAKISFETYDLYHYRSEIKTAIEDSRNKIPSNFILKSTYDLVQSIFYSIKHEEAYNWIICEGISEKIYFEYFFKDEIESKKLRILPMGGQSKVIRLYKYLKNPISEEKCNGKVFCIIDTDQIRCEEINSGCKTLAIRRLSNMNNHEKTELLTLDHSDTSTTDIEKSLHPVLFNLALNELTKNEQYQINKIVNESGNSDFIKNFKNLDLDDFFKENNGENKVIFANKYVELANMDEHSEHQEPSWITEVKTFFH